MFFWSASKTARDDGHLSAKPTRKASRASQKPLDPTPVDVGRNCWLQGKPMPHLLAVAAKPGDSGEVVCINRRINRN